jgi:hypothetical protein
LQSVDSQHVGLHLSDTTAEDIIKLITVSMNTCRILKRIPLGSRNAAAEKLCQLLGRIQSNPDDVQGWVDILLFASCCFKIPDGGKARGGRGHQASLATKLNETIRMYPGRPASQQNIEHGPRRSIHNKLTPMERLAVSVSAKIEDGDVRGAVRLAASDDMIATYCQETIDELVSKHPRAVAPLQLTATNIIEPLKLLEPVIAGAIKSFPAGSAGGLDGLRPQHLKDMIGGQTGMMGQRLLTLLTEFANICLCGRVPAVVRPVFCGASLCALSKKDGGIRPIAVGCTLRRLVAKAACSVVRDRVAEQLAPLQLGFGIKQGAEAAAHAARCYISNISPGEAFLKIDFTNAFNAISRDEIFSSSEEYTPELLPFINVCYGQPSFLLYGESVIMSEQGLQQGDPLGPMFYCTSTQKLISKLKTEYGQWYLDDGSLGGKVDDLMLAFLSLKSEAAKIGLHVNVKKCELITADQSVIHKFLSIAPDIAIVDPDAAVLLGAPVGGQQSIDQMLEKKLTELQRLSHRLKGLKAHDAFYLLRNCFSLPKLQYMLRCSPCFTSSVIARYDDCIRSTLECLLNVQLADNAWMQASLPVSAGGLGVRTADQIVLPGFLSSMIGCTDLCQKLLPIRLHSITGKLDRHFIDACEQWKRRTPAIPPFDCRQKKWDLPLVDATLSLLLNTAPNQAAVARLSAVSAQHAGAFLNAIPIKAIGTRMDDKSLRIAIALRLGAPVCAEHQCICGATVDINGLHGLSCRKSKGRIARHTAVNGLIKRALLSAEIPSRLEPTKLLHYDNKRPDGVTIMPWSRGQSLAWDFTCPDTLAASHLNIAVTGPGQVANHAEQQKIDKYAALSNEYQFTPIAVETLGPVGEEATRFLQELGRRIEAVTKDSRSMTFLWQRLSVAVQKGNAACVLGTEHWEEEDTLGCF